VAGSRRYVAGASSHRVIDRPGVSGEL